MYWITGLLGLVFIVAPFVLGYTTDPTALWASVILGAGILLVSGYKALVRDMTKWEYSVAGLLGLLAILAPFVLGFSAFTAALWTTLILGAVVAILAAYEVFIVKPA